MNKNFSNSKFLNGNNYLNDAENVFRKVNSKSTNEGLNSIKESSIKNFDNNFLKENLDKYFDKEMSLILKKIKNDNYFKTEDEDFLKKIKEKEEKEEKAKNKSIKKKINKSFSDDISNDSQDSFVKTNQLKIETKKNNSQNNETIKIKKIHPKKEKNKQYRKKTSDKKNEKKIILTKENKKNPNIKNEKKLSIIKEKKKSILKNSNKKSLIKNSKIKQINKEKNISFAKPQTKNIKNEKRISFGNKNEQKLLKKDNKKESFGMRKSLVKNSKPTGFLLGKKSLVKESKPTTGLLLGRKSLVKDSRAIGFFENNTNKKSKEKTYNIKQPEIINQPKRVSIMGRSKMKELFYTQKLAPILVGNEYLFQTIEETDSKINGHKIVVITKNDQGQIINEEEIQNNGTNYYNEVIVSSENGNIKNLLVLKNDEGEIIHGLKVSPTNYILSSTNFLEDLDVENFKKGIISEKYNNKKKFTLNTIQFKDRIYSQEVTENLDKKNLLLVTKKGDIVLDTKEVNWSKKGKSYFSVVKEDEIQNFNIETKNDIGEILGIFDLKDEILSYNNRKSVVKKKIKDKYQVITHKLNPFKIGDFTIFPNLEIETKYGETLNFLKIFDENNDLINEIEVKGKLNSPHYFSELEGGKELFINVKDANGKTISLIKLPEKFRKIQNKNKFDEININTNNHQKSIVLKKDSINERFKSTMLRPTLIGDKFYYQIINEILIKDEENDDIRFTKSLKEIKKSLKKNNLAKIITIDEDGQIINKKSIDLSKISDNYYNKIVEDNIDKFGKRKITLLTYNQKEEVICAEVMRPTVTAIVDLYMNEVIEEVVDENNKVRLTNLKKDKKGRLIIRECKEFEPKIAEKNIVNPKTFKKKHAILENYFFNKGVNLVKKKKDEEVLLIQIMLTKQEIKVKV